VGPSLWTAISPGRVCFVDCFLRALSVDPLFSYDRAGVCGLREACTQFTGLCGHEAGRAPYVPPHFRPPF